MQLEGSVDVVLLLAVGLISEFELFEPSLAKLTFALMSPKH